MQDRPPKDITPAEFFETWLPAQYQRVAGDLSKTPPDATICVELSGDGGGAWTLALAGGTLTVTAAAADSAHITVRQGVDDWRSITVGTVGTIGTVGTQDAEMPSAASLSASIDKLLTSPALGQLLGGVQGTLRFEIPGLMGRDFATAVTFQGAAEPQATIRVDAETLDQIRSGALPAPQAFFAGKIQMSGDTAFAMQVGMAAMTPAS